MPTVFEDKEDISVFCDLICVVYFLLNTCQLGIFFFFFMVSYYFLDEF